MRICNFTYYQLPVCHTFFFFGGGGGGGCSLWGRDNEKSLEIFHRLPNFPFGPSLVWPMFATRRCSLASTADLMPVRV